jgi:long-chain fatty acid transport protein
MAAAALATVLALPALPLHAGNGYFTHGFGPANKAMAGAGVALPTTSMGAAINPALMAHVGNRLDAGAALFKPVRGFSADPGAPMPVGTYEKDDDLIVIPHFGWNKMLDGDRAIGVSVGGNGVSTEYDVPVFGGFNNPSGTASVPTGAEFAQVFAVLNYAHRVTPEHTLGVGPVLAAQRFRVDGLQPFQGVSLHPDSVTNKEYDYAYGGGLKLGWYWTPQEWLSLGASYQSRLYMTEFDKYKGLLAEEGDFDTPPIMQAGFAIKPDPAWTVAVDVQRLLFSDIKAVSNRNDVAMPPPVLLGSEGGLGFGWRDMTLYKLGVQWQAAPAWTWRAGYSIGNQIIPGNQALLNILAPGVVRQHVTGGLSWTMNDKHEFSLAAAYVPEERVQFTNPNTNPQTGTIQMHQYDLELSWSYRF